MREGVGRWFHALMWCSNCPCRVAGTQRALLAFSLFRGVPGPFRQLLHAPRTADHEAVLRAASATYGDALPSHPNGPKALITPASEITNITYRNALTGYACAGPKPPRILAAKAHRIRKDRRSCQTNPCQTGWPSRSWSRDPPDSSHSGPTIQDAVSFGSLRRMRRFSES